MARTANRKAILLDDVEHLGHRGEIVAVSRGYLRNYLVPRKLAEEATPARVREVEGLAATRAAQEARTAEQDCLGSVLVDRLAGVLDDQALGALDVLLDLEHAQRGAADRRALLRETGTVDRLGNEWLDAGDHGDNRPAVRDQARGVHRGLGDAHDGDVADLATRV